MHRSEPVQPLPGVLLELLQQGYEIGLLLVGTAASSTRSQKVPQLGPLLCVSVCPSVCVCPTEAHVCSGSRFPQHSCPHRFQLLTSTEAHVVSGVRSLSSAMALCDHGQRGKVSRQWLEPNVLYQVHLALSRSRSCSLALSLSLHLSSPPSPGRASPR